MEIPNERGHRLYYELGQAYLQEQQNRFGAIESKATWNLGFAATLVAILGIILPEAASWSRWLAIVAGAFFWGSVALGFWSLRVRDFWSMPTPTELFVHMNEYNEETLREWAADAIKDNAAKNDNVLAAKACALTWALSLFLVEATLIAIVAISIAFV